MKRVLFICEDNAHRSQMAEAFARQFGSDDTQAYSAGWRPADMIDPRCAEMMREIGNDIVGQHTKSVESLRDMHFDAVVAIVDGHTAPVQGRALTAIWTIADPSNVGDEQYREIRHDLGSHVRRLMSALEADDSEDAQAD